MRLLTVAECNIIGGGSGGTPATAIIMARPTPNTATLQKDFAWTTQLICTTPFSAGLTFEMTGAGRIIAIKGGISVALPAECRTITTNAITGETKNCDYTGQKCVVTDAKGNVVNVHADTIPGDTGVERMMSNMDLYDQYDNLLVDWSANIYESGTEPTLAQPASANPVLLLAA